MFSNPHKEDYSIRIYKTFGIKAGKTELYKQAFTHRSVSADHESSNERLEFLGDSVINILVSEYLYVNFPVYDEGYLSKFRSSIVKRESLNQLAIDIGIKEILQIDKSIRFKNGSSLDIYGNAFEAFIGAIFLDKGMRFTRNYLIQNVLRKYINIDQIIQGDSNYKGKLYELAQKEDVKIRFVIQESGPKDNPVYDATVYVNDEEMGNGTGSKKKKAEQKAAKEAFLKLKTKEAL